MLTPANLIKLSPPLLYLVQLKVGNTGDTKCRCCARSDNCRIKACIRINSYMSTTLARGLFTCSDSDRRYRLREGSRVKSCCNTAANSPRGTSGRITSLTLDYFLWIPAPEVHNICRGLGNEDDLEKEKRSEKHV